MQQAIPVGQQTRCSESNHAGQGQAAVARKPLQILPLLRWEANVQSGIICHARQHTDRQISHNAPTISEVRMTENDSQKVSIRFSRGCDEVEF
jgi:hypothetical protein